MTFSLQMTCTTWESSTTLPKSLLCPDRLWWNTKKSCLRLIKSKPKILLVSISNLNRVHPWPNRHYLLISIRVKIWISHANKFTIQPMSCRVACLQTTRVTKYFTTRCMPIRWIWCALSCLCIPMSWQTIRFNSWLDCPHPSIKNKWKISTHNFNKFSQFRRCSKQISNQSPSNQHCRA